MTPDSLESRMAALKQHVDDLATDVHALVGLSTQQAVLAEQLTTIRENVRGIRKDLDGLHEGFRQFNADAAARDTAIRKEIADREATQLKERKTDRKWLVGALLASTTMIIGAVSVMIQVLG